MMTNRTVRKSLDVTRSMTERTRIPWGDFIWPSLTLRCRVSLASDIRNALSDDRQALFRRTPFGDWLDVTMHGGDPMLIHMFMQRQIEVANADSEELYYDIGGHIRRFGREEFLLVTGFRFGSQPTISAVHGDAFVRRVFPAFVTPAPRGQPLRLKISDVRARFHDMSSLSDEDAVRVCSILMVEIAFLGRQPHQYVSDVVIRAIEDFNTWNEYPWGSLIWSATYRQMDGAFTRRVEPSGKMTMSGFLYAFKIWILEMFPISSTYFTKTNRYPRGIRWERSVVLSKAHCLEFFKFPNDGRHPRERLVAEPFEEERAWYRDSHVWFKSPASRRPPKRTRRIQEAQDLSSPGSGSSTDSLSNDNDEADPQHSSAHHHDHPGFGHEPPHDDPMDVGPNQFRWDQLDQLRDDFYGYKVSHEKEHNVLVQQQTNLERRVKAMEDLGGLRVSGQLSHHLGGLGGAMPAPMMFRCTLSQYSHHATPGPSYHVPNAMSYDMTGPSYATQPVYTQFVDYYEATLTIKARISVAKDIFVKLRESDRRLALFRDTCFGPWLDIRSTNGDPLLIHLILQTQFFPEGALADDMWFCIGGHELRFGQEEFCLITGFRFGPMDALQEISSNPFRDRVFPDMPAHQHVKGSDLWSVFTSTTFDQIPDLDAVRICLLLLLEVGFSGRQPHLVVTDFLLCLVEDLESWNRYPWGSYLWALTHPQLKTALPRRQQHVGVKADRISQYTLTGFVFAFKIWIFETFPVARRFALRSDVIPRAIAWQWTQTIMWDMCLTFLDVDDDGRQPLTVTPTDVERETDWWRDSRRFFNNITDDFQPPTKRGRSYSPPRLPPPQPSPLSSFSGIRTSVPDAVTAVPPPLEQRVAVLERAVRDLQSGQRSLEAGQRDLEAGQRATQAGQRAILESMAQLHEMVQRALEAKHRTKVRLKDTRPINVDDDVAEGAP